VRIAFAGQEIQVVGYCRFFIVIVVFFLALFVLASELKRTTSVVENRLTQEQVKKVDALSRYSRDQLVLSLEPF